MSETTEAKSGAVLIKEIENERRSILELQIKRVLEMSITGIENRKKWIAAREAQIGAIVELQSQIIKLYDIDKLDELQLVVFKGKLEVLCAANSRGATYMRRRSATEEANEDNID